jgi:hypothetical protein
MMSIYTLIIISGILFAVTAIIAVLFYSYLVIKDKGL